MNLSAKQRETHRHREETCGCQGREIGGGKYWEFGFSLFYIENGLTARSYYTAQGIIFNILW